MMNEQVTTIELTAGTPSTVEFSGAYPYYWVDNRSAGDVYASLGTPEAGTDGTYTIAAGSQLRISGGAFNTKLCLLGSGKVQVIASSIATPPFQGVKKGGGYAVAGSSSYALNNAVDYPVLGLNLYGKSTQDGVPTPDTPVDIVSVGDSGAVEIEACEKNLFPWNDYTKAPINSWGQSSGCTYKVTSSEIQMEVAPNTAGTGGGVFIWQDNYKDLISPYYGNTFTISYELRADSEITVRHGFEIAGTYFDSVVGTEWKRFSCSTTIKKPCNIGWKTINQPETILYIRKIQIEIGDTATDYEPYKGSTSTITSALPLCGIPVDNYGNYTDSNGQQWACDELIYNADGTGKIVKHTGKVVYDGSDDENWLKISTGTSGYVRFMIKLPNLYNANIPNTVIPDLFCDRYKAITRNDTWFLVRGICVIIKDNESCILIYDDAASNKLENFKSMLAANPVTVVYQLEEPQEIVLTASEITALRQLQTFDGVSNISNDNNADMDVKYCTNKMLSEYVFPITMGLQNQIDELKAAVLSLGGNV